MIEKEKWGRLGFEKIDIQGEKTMGDRLDDLPNELNSIEQLKELKTILLDRHHIADCEALDMAIKALEQQKTGHWIAQDIHNCHTDFKCSECDYIHSFMHLYGEPTADYTYCPNCGATMVESEVGE